MKIQITAVIILFSLMVGLFMPVSAWDENGGTSGGGVTGGGSYAEYWSYNNHWYGMRITIVDVTGAGAAVLNGTVRGKVASGTVSVDLVPDNIAGFFTRTLAGDGSTPLARGTSVYNFGKVSKLAYRDGEALAGSFNVYDYESVPNMPIVLANNPPTPAAEFKAFINNIDMVKNILNWCKDTSGLTYETLTNGNYKLLVEPIMFILLEDFKFAFTATEAAMYLNGKKNVSNIINKTLGNAFFLEEDELGWYAWANAKGSDTPTGNTPYADITAYTGMHIYSLAPETTTRKSVKILKKSDTGASLNNAQFSVTGNGKNEAVTVNGTLTLDLDGWANGTYTVTETTAPSGFDLDATPQTFTLSESGVAPSELTFVNSPTTHKSVKILKKSDVGASLNGAQFSVTGNGKNETVTVNGTLTLDLDGWANGTYTVTETTSPSGFDLDATPQTFTLSENGVAPSELTFVNTFTPPPHVEVDFRKVEYGTETGLGGGVFKVTQLSHWETKLIGEAWEWLEIRETEEVGTFLSGADGAIPVGELEAGSYTIEEISPPAGYVLAETIGERLQFFDVPREGGYTPKITFANKKLPGLTVIKVDEDTGEPLANAEFSVKHNGNIIHEGLTDSTGVINLDNLPAGWYEITELAAPHGYLKRDESKSVYLEAGGSAQVKFDNRRKPTLELVKVDAMTKQPLSGATFRVWTTEGATVGEFTTDANGKVTITDLDDIIYSVEEISAPDGYLLDAQHKDVKLEWGKVTTLTFTDRLKPGLTITKVDEQTGAALANAEFSVARKGGAIVYEGKTDGNGKISLTDLAEGWYTVTETAAPYGYIIVNTAKDVYLEGGAIVDVRFMNRRKPTLKIVKIDERTGARLKGAKFKVWATEGDTVGEFVTDANGTITIPNLDDKIYSVEEITAPNGYVLNPQTKQILLEWGKINTLTFTNLKKPTLTIYKYDELTNLPLAGASFRLWKTEGETWSETQITGADGKITWTDLDPGIYSIQEIDEPYGYFKDPARKEILLKGGDNKTLEFFNRPRPILTILKRDAITGEPLQNVKFRVQKLEGATIGEFLTDANGRIELSPKTGYLLDEAIYRVTEILPPNEYLLSANPQKDVLLKWYQPTELIFENILKPTLIFIKRDGMSGRGISGATYRVDYESPTGGVTNLGSYTTKCGLIVIPHVLPGWYSLTETQAAPGYSLPTNPTQRLHLAPGENSYTYAQTHEDLYVDARTNPNSGQRGMCGDWCGYLCSVLCAGNCGNPGDGTMANGTGGTFGSIKITNGKGETLGNSTPTSASDPPKTAHPQSDPPDFGGVTVKGGTVVYINPDFSGITITFGSN